MTSFFSVNYLVDFYNHTGYAQVLEEWAVEGSTATLTCYTLGDDVIAQTKSDWQFISSQWELQSTGNTQYLLYDGHGSTRQLAEYNTEVSIVDSFSYDGYGVLLQDKDNFPPNGTQDPGKVAPQATSLLYAGEQFDLDAQQYYLRARTMTRTSADSTEWIPSTAARKTHNPCISISMRIAIRLMVQIRQAWSLA